ncbi:hypothetical protein JEQ32_28445 [Klebsiella pneumoniae]|uniref:hypothetical protein n=1 Tax=Klebsiella pneumoniae TaxID=573 RepID=UPI001BD0CF20|nr:hypothetical protein [Klebsiella pneumoniae]MBS4500936.1 hypothetical protein [Klebsiella pneumoniae]
MRSLSSTVLNSLINSFVQMGVEWAKNAIMGLPLSRLPLSPLLRFKMLPWLLRLAFLLPQPLQQLLHGRLQR